MLPLLLPGSVLEIPAVHLSSSLVCRRFLFLAADIFDCAGLISIDPICVVRHLTNKPAEASAPTGACSEKLFPICPKQTVKCLLKIPRC